MAPVRRLWFRLYVEAFSDPKVRRLDVAHRWLWAAVLGAARQSPEPGRLLIAAGQPFDGPALADFAAVPLRDVRKGMVALEAAGFVTMHPDGGWAVSKWAERQFESDDVTVRTSKHRAVGAPSNGDGTFHRRSTEHPIPVPGNGDGTRPENREQRVVKPPPPLNSTSPRASAGGGGPSRDPRVNQALDLLVDAEQRAETSPIRNLQRWRAGVRQRIDADHGQALDQLAAAHPDVTASGLAARITDVKPREYFTATGETPAPDAADRIRAIKAGLAP